VNTIAIAYLIGNQILIKKDHHYDGACQRPEG
jgi:hypothetical protein